MQRTTSRLAFIAFVSLAGFACKKEGETTPPDDTAAPADGGAADDGAAAEGGGEAPAEGEGGEEAKKEGGW